ncbi:MAG: small, acid-soluble spore protein, alpha/beta type [Lachnospiraceae bacterium]|nr:small, acid-soluble spore protein, alpha/beta type [Lachnospiraceae bacterium]
MGKKKKEIDFTNLTPEEEIKYEIARELGVFDRIVEQGWGCLSAQEAGRIGGIMTQRRRSAEAAKTKEDGEAAR